MWMTMMYKLPTVKMFGKGFGILPTTPVAYNIMIENDERKKQLLWNHI